MREAHDLLARARKTIEKPEHWTQHCVARDADGFPAVAESSDAVCFSALGALLRSEGGRTHCDAALGALKRALPEGAGRLVAPFNDHPNTTHADVLALFDRAIASLEEEIDA